MKETGRRLSLALAARGIHKQMAFAAEIGVDESVVSRWKRGGNLSLTNAIRVCDTLDISLDWLLLGRGKMDAEGKTTTGAPQDRVPPQKRESEPLGQLNTDDLPPIVTEALAGLLHAIREVTAPDRGDV